MPVLEFRFVQIYDSNVINHVKLDRRRKTVRLRVPKTKGLFVGCYYITYLLFIIVIIIYNYKILFNI